MLTKSDLNQIGEVIDSRLDRKLDSALSPIKKDLKSLKKDVKYLKKSVDLIVKNYDEGDVKLDKRLKKVEHHLNIPS